MAYAKTNWLDAASTTQVTSSEEVPDVSKYGLQVSTTGSPASVQVLVEGSIDGVNWMGLLSVTSATTGWVADRPMKFVRLNLAMLSGGTSPTVSASLIAV